MMALNVCPSLLAEGFQNFSPRSCRELFDGERVSCFLDFKLTEVNVGLDSAYAAGRISVSGVQEKFSAIIRNQRIQFAGDNERSTHILKPAPWDQTLNARKQIPANEHLTMQLAGQVYGIETAANGLCFFADGQAVYLTRRFDLLPDGSKSLMEDFASLVNRADTGNSGFKYQGCYEQIARIIMNTVPAWMVDMERLFNIIVFNYIYANGDAHLKNFSLMQRNGSWRLAPAYDLMNTALHIDGDDFALDSGLSPKLERSDVYHYTGHPCRLDFERFGALIGLNPQRIKRVLDRYQSLPDLALHLIKNSFLLPKMQRSYIRIVTERIQRFNRKSE